jgi:hypothetical protein
MKKEELIQEAITVWCNYGKAINCAFEFKDFYIESEPLQKIIASNSEEKIQSFISYVKKRIEELEQMEN